MKWAEITLTTSQEASEAVANRLFDLNSVGVEIQDNPAPFCPTATLICYFPMDDLVGERLQKVQRFLDQLSHSGIRPGETSGTCTPMRKYLGDLFNLPPAGLTSEVLVELEGRGVESEILDRFGEFFELCDSLRFAPAELKLEEMWRLFARPEGTMKRLSERSG